MRPKRNKHYIPLSERIYHLRNPCFEDSRKTPEAEGNINLYSNDGEKFSVNACDLESQSEFFRGLLYSGMKETEDRSVNFPSLSFISLKQAVSFITDGELLIKGNDFDLLAETVASATYLQIQCMIDEVSRVMKEWTSKRNYTEIISLAKSYDLFGVEKSAVQWSFDNGAEYLKSLHFLSSTIDAVKRYIMDDRVNVVSEFNIFTAVNMWIEKHKDTQEDVLSLFDYIRFELMDLSNLEVCSEILRSSYGENVCSLTERIKTIIEAHTSPATFYKVTQNCKPRCMDNFVVAIGGFRTTERSSNMMQIISSNSLTSCSSDHKEQFFGCDKEKLPTTVCEHAVAVLNNDIYVAGGQTRYCQNGRHTTNKVYRFNMCTQKWTAVQSMNVTRSLFYLCTLHNKVFAIMGWLGPDKVTKSVEVYTPETDSWQLLQSLEIGVHEHAGCILNGEIYISGGYKGPLRGHLDRAWHFTPPRSVLDLGYWTEIARMNKSRSYHVMTAVDDKLFVAGGVQYHYQDDRMENIEECEVYSPSLDQWSVVSRVPHVGSCMGHVMLGNQLVMFGGHCFNDDSADTIHRKLQVLNVNTWEWTVTEYTANKVNFFACAVVNIPNVFSVKFTKVEEK